MADRRGIVAAALALAMLAASAAVVRAEADGPDFYRVSGVAAADVLNIRAGPSAKDRATACARVQGGRPYARLLARRGRRNERRRARDMLAQARRSATDLGMTGPCRRIEAVRDHNPP